MAKTPEPSGHAFSVQGIMSLKSRALPQVGPQQNLLTVVGEMRKDETAYHIKALVTIAYNLSLTPVVHKTDS